MPGQAENECAPDETEAPPRLVLLPQWTLTLTPRKLTLIRAALGGRLKEADLEEAQELDRELAEQTVKETRTRLTQTDKLANNLKEKRS